MECLVLFTAIIVFFCFCYGQWLKIIVADTDRLLSTMTANLRHNSEWPIIVKTSGWAFSPLASQLSKMLTVLITQWNIHCPNWRELSYMSTVGPTTRRGRALVAVAGRSVTSSDLDFWPYHICDKRMSVASVQNRKYVPNWSAPVHGCSVLCAYNVMQYYWYSILYLEDYLFCRSIPEFF